ncbi:MAG TPA: TonB-dependent receptor [Candidatus Competibacter sp.]|nr:TonB-dependent receptor [Candidatus Competibacter sp.]
MKSAGRTPAGSTLVRLPLAVAVGFALCSGVWAQSQDTDEKTESPTLQTITVTSQKRTEDVQDVPISIQVLGADRLEETFVADFDDFAKEIPSLSYGTAGGGVFSGPGFLQVYMRGVASGGDGNHSGSQPSVGMYLDDQPITTIQGALDIHMYDIERVEALAGPQGTLYGASSQAGTIRIITRKPDKSRTESSFSAELSSIKDGGIGHVLEGMFNAPIGEISAIRLVGWEKHDAGYVDNVPGTVTFPTSGITIGNQGLAKKNYNTADTYGARAALQIDLNEDWIVTPTVMGQRQKAYGSAGYDPSVGDLEVTHFNPESSNDRWTQAALAVQGKIGNFDLNYSFANLNRDVDSEADYNDYAFWYDTLAGYGAYFYDDDGALISPSQYIQAADGYSKHSHELRISSPAEDRLRFVAGVFWQQQTHDILQNYRVDGIASAIEVPGWPDTIWLTSQKRRDRDEALFGEVSFDVTDKLTLTGGMRWFKARNSLKGFFGYGAGFSSGTGEAACFSSESLAGAPCTNLDKQVRESDHIGRFNATYHLSDSKMIYATWSEGYRPGGINRRGTLPPYKSDFLTNWEFGWKTAWANNSVIFNGAVFRENWDDFQFSFLGQNGLTEIRNANQGRIDGTELELEWAASYNLTISGGLAWYDAKLTADYCAQTDDNGVPVPDCYLPERPYDIALAGSRLPVTPKLKYNVNARYAWDLWEGEAYWQASLAHQGDRVSDLREAQREILGDLAAYELVDLSVGFRRNGWKLDFFVKNAFDKRAELTRFSECAALTCGYQPYTVTAQPRTFGVRYSHDF